MNIKSLELSRLREAIAGALALRRRRAQHMPGRILGEPAWDLMLGLALESRSNRGHTLEALSREIGLPGSLAQRWLNILIDEDLVERNTGQFANTSYNLTSHGWQVLSNCFANGAAGQGS